MPAAQKIVLGTCDCPVCHTPGQEVRESEKKRPYLMCDECDVQIFARSRRSADALLALITKKINVPPVAAVPTTKPAPAPAPTPEPPKNEPPKPAPARAEPPAKRAGLFGRR